MIFKIFSPKNSAKKLAFLTQNKAKLCKYNIGFFEKNANFFAENCQKSQKIVIITSTPGYHSLVAAHPLKVNNITHHFADIHVQTLTINSVTTYVCRLAEFSPVEKLLNF
jgi:hypothetical protein